RSTSGPTVTAWPAVIGAVSGTPDSTGPPPVTRAYAVRRRPACPSPVCLSPGQRRRDLCGPDWPRLGWRNLDRPGLEWLPPVTRLPLRPSGGPLPHRSAPSPATRPPGHLKGEPSAARSPA
ncbi:MAG TPA: hypothetical protein VIH64_07445, partial [Streptosporangiaceae bacterium]